MGDKDNQDKRDRIAISPSPQLREFLLRLTATGIYGKSPTEVARTLIGLQIERLLREGILKLPEPRLSDLIADDDREG